ncbi:helix-turn-helix transcriptional regulator [Raoultella terrigena]|uniref:helix-turn-helix domain-containing protein n=2 Tax=Klebsiella/Raoultella group TaxID=2890311 RepID=UPI002AA5747A
MFRQQKSTLSGMKNTHDKHLPNARIRISLNLKRLRTEKGLSQEKTAELANFHRTYVSQLERCVTNISIDGLERLAYALEVDVTELLRIPCDD